MTKKLKYINPIVTLLLSIRLSKKITKKMNYSCFSITSRIADGRLTIFSQSSYKIVNKLPLLPMKPLQYLIVVETISVYILTPKNCITVSWITLIKPFDSLKTKKMKQISVMPPILFYGSISFTVLFT